MEDALHEQNPFAGKELTGCLEIRHIDGKSVATRLYATYPIKLIMPTKVASSTADVVWIYLASFGGGLVSGDSIYFKVNVGSSCRTALTTQASTKVYKSVEGKVSEQVMEARIGSKGFFALLPDPITCFAAAKYNQLQRFHLATDANLILVDWFTSGRRERNEVWAFDQFRSTNQIFLDDGGVPLLLDSIFLEQGLGLPITSRMQQFHVVAMLVVYGPEVNYVRKLLEDSVKSTSQKMFTMQSKSNVRKESVGDGMGEFFSSPLVASCSPFGPKDCGLVVRVMATTTEMVYDFLRSHLACLSSLVGAVPYAGK